MGVGEELYHIHLCSGATPKSGLRDQSLLASLGRPWRVPSKTLVPGKEPRVTKASTLIPILSSDLKQSLSKRKRSILTDTYREGSFFSTLVKVFCLSVCLGG